MGRYELPERRTPSKLRLVIPTLALLAVVLGGILGAVYALVVTLDFVTALFEAAP